MAVQGDQPIFSFVRSVMVIPLVTKEQILGLLSMGHSKPNYYTLEQANLVRAFANQVAVSIENATLYARAKRGADVAQAMHNVNQAINHRLELMPILSMIAVEAKRITATEAGVVCLIRDETVRVAAVSGKPTADFVGAEFPMGDTVAGRVQGKASATTVDLTIHSAHELVDRAWYPKAREALVVPILSGIKLIGTLAIYSEKSRQISPADHLPIVKLASIAAIAMRIDAAAG
jgi:GAF domain-containing protein